MSGVKLSAQSFVQKSNYSSPSHAAEKMVDKNRKGIELPKMESGSYTYAGVGAALAGARVAVAAGTASINHAAANAGKSSVSSVSIRKVEPLMEFAQENQGPASIDQLLRQKSGILD